MNLEVQLEREREKFRSIQQIARAVGSTLDLDELLHLIVGKITELMDADRSTLYVLNEDAHRALDQGAPGRRTARDPPQGRGGGRRLGRRVTGETVNIEDAYKDKRFNPDVDSRSGYRTRSILCTPMRDNQGKIIGVVQVLNKRGGKLHRRGRGAARGPGQPGQHRHREQPALPVRGPQERAAARGPGAARAAHAASWICCWRWRSRRRDAGSSTSCSTGSWPGQPS